MSAPGFTSFTALCSSKVSRVLPWAVISHWSSFISIRIWLYFSNGSNCHKRTWARTQCFELKTLQRFVYIRFHPAVHEVLSEAPIPLHPLKDNDKTRKEVKADKEQEAPQRMISLKKPVTLCIISRKELEVSSHFKIRVCINSAAINSPLWISTGRMRLHNYNRIIAFQDPHHLKPHLLLLFLIWESLPGVISCSSCFTK